jgi:steroid delta-isomerase-like uncharacterized protein
MSTPSDSRLIHRLFEDVINRRNVAAADSYIHPDYVNHDFPSPAPGAEGFKAVVGFFLEAFPDMTVNVEDEFGTGDQIASRGRFTGTHRGNFMGVPATGKTVNISYVDIWRLEDGKLRENWVQMDLLGLMQQLGVVPAPAQ